MKNVTPAMIYGALLHVAALVSLVVLVALGKITWAEGGPIIGGLVGLGVGVPVTLSTPASQTPTPEPPAVVPVVPLAAMPPAPPPTA